MIFAQQISIGAYPAEKYNIASVTAVQSTLIAIVALNIITAGALITATFGIGLDLMCSAYNKVYELVQDDIDEFEKWMKENKMDGAKLKKDLENGKVQKGDGKDGNNSNDGGNGEKIAKESTLHGKVKWRRIDEGLLSGLAKVGAKAVGKLFGKGAAKVAAKGATKAAAKGAAKATTKTAAKTATKTAVKGATKAATKSAAKTTTGKLAGKLAP